MNREKREKRTLSRPMEIEEVMSPLLPQTFRVVEPAESGRQTGSVSEGDFGCFTGGSRRA